MSSCGCWESDGSCGCWTGRSGTSSAQLKLYRTIIFCVPIFFALILVFLFYMFYLRPRRALHSIPHFPLPHHNPTSIRFGLNKELRELLPILIYNQSFSIRDTQCSVCLVDYLSGDRLQQIPACGHTFHMNCIDTWLSTHTTCPLCRYCLLTSAKSSTHTHDMQNNEETQGLELSEARSASHQEAAVLQNVSEEVSISSHCIDVEGQNVQNNQ